MSDHDDTAEHGQLHATLTIVAADVSAIKKALFEGNGKPSVLSRLSRLETIVSGVAWGIGTLIAIAAVYAASR